MENPHIDISEEEFEKLPIVKHGDVIQCSLCGQYHILEVIDSEKVFTQDSGNTGTLIYKCRNKYRFGAFENRLLADRFARISLDNCPSH